MGARAALARGLEKIFERRVGGALGCAISGANPAAFLGLFGVVPRLTVVGRIAQTNPDFLRGFDGAGAFVFLRQTAREK